MAGCESKVYGCVLSTATSSYSLRADICNYGYVLTMLVMYKVLTRWDVYLIHTVTTKYTSSYIPISYFVWLGVSQRFMVVS